MTRTLLRSAVLALLAATFSLAAGGQQFTIRVLDAYGGKPVVSEVLNVWTGKGLAVNSPDRAKLSPIYYTDNAGNAVITPRSGADTLSLVVGSIPCEPHPKDDPDLNFGLHEILTHGVVSDNVCGKAHATPIPGVLIVFVKHRPWWQIGDLTQRPETIEDARPRSPDKASLSDRTRSTPAASPNP